jgi:hypothetical protein
MITGTGTCDDGEPRTRTAPVDNGSKRGRAQGTGWRCTGKALAESEGFEPKLRGGIIGAFPLAATPVMPLEPPDLAPDLAPDMTAARTLL